MTFGKPKISYEDWQMQLTVMNLHRQTDFKQKRKASYNACQQERAHSQRLDSYHERQTQINGRKGQRSNHVCCECRKTFKITRSSYRCLRNKSNKAENEFPTCPNCGSKRIYDVGIGARVPRPKASDSCWKRFEFLFVDHKGYYTKEQQDEYRTQKIEMEKSKLLVKS